MRTRVLNNPKLSGTNSALIPSLGTFSILLDVREVQITNSEAQVIVKDKGTAGSGIRLVIDSSSKKQVSKHKWEMPGKLTSVSLPRGVLEVTCTYED